MLESQLRGIGPTPAEFRPLAPHVPIPSWIAHGSRISWVTEALRIMSCSIRLCFMHMVSDHLQSANF